MTRCRRLSARLFSPPATVLGLDLSAVVGEARAHRRRLSAVVGGVVRCRRRSRRPLKGDAFAGYKAITSHPERNPTVFWKGPGPDGVHRIALLAREDR